MSSPSGDPRRPSLSRRVLFASAGAAALGGALAGVVGGIAANQLVSAHEDAVVIAAARDLGDEIDEEIRGDADQDDEDDDDDTDHRAPADALAHELEDVDLPAARAGLRTPSGAVVGALDLPRSAPDTCVVAQRGGTQRRTCTIATAQGELTLDVDAESERTRSQLFAMAVFWGALFGAAMGAMLSVPIGRWAVAPLAELRERVRRIAPEAPDAEPLRAPARHAEIEELRRAIAELVAHLSAALSHAQSFAARAAHELRTPLSTIAGELELLAEDAGDRTAIDRTRGQIASLIALVQRLLVLARPGDAVAREGTAVDLADVVAAVQERLAPELAARLRVRTAEDVLVRGDAELLRVLLANAVDNALKFAAGPVDVDVAVRGDEACIDVIDDGPGIPTDEREKVFAPFYRSAHVRAAGPVGHGIGLALVAHVAAAHRGRVELVARTRGTHLGIRLPRWT